MVTREKEVALRLMGRTPFGQVPHVVGWDKNISDGAFHTYYVFCCRSGQKKKTWITEKRLAHDRGCSLSTIERHVKELRESGLIETRRKGCNRWDKCLVPVEEVYENTVKPYAQSQRIVPPEKEDHGDFLGGLEPLKNEGSDTPKNEGYIEEEKNRNRKPDTSYPGELPFGQPLDQSPEPSHGTAQMPLVLNFQQKVRELHLSFPEVKDMALKPPRHSQETPKGMPDPETKQHSRGLMTDPDGNPEGEKKKPKKLNKTKVKIHDLWHDWKWMIKGTFQIPVPGALPTGSNYGHLKNIVNFSGGDKDYALQLLRYVVDRWEEVKKGNFRAERMNVPTLYLVDALKEELHANIQTGKSFEPKPEKPTKHEGGRGVHRHADNWDGLEKLWKEKHSG